MNKFIKIGTTLVVGVILFESFGETSVMKKDGAAPGYTGSPGDTLKNCTACHGGTAAYFDGWITSNIPSTGYEPGKRYTISATNTDFGDTHFGFEVSPQSQAGALLGTMIVTDTVQTKLIENDKYITYTKDGILGVDTKTWNFDWIAPASGLGDVVFYGAFNSNVDGHKGGDNTYLSSLRVFEKGTSSLTENANTNFNLSIFPSPASSFTSISFEVKIKALAIAEIFDVDGKKVQSILHEMCSGKVVKNINTEQLPAGVYFLKLQIGAQTSTSKIVISH